MTLCKFHAMCLEPFCSERASCAFHHSSGRKLSRCHMSLSIGSAFKQGLSQVEMPAPPAANGRRSPSGHLPLMATKGARVCARLARLLRHAGSWVPPPPTGVLLGCREVVIQWTDGYPRRSTVLVNLGTTPQLGQRYDGSVGSSVIDASYTRADMLGPRANSYGYFWPGARTLCYPEGLGCPFTLIRILALLAQMAVPSPHKCRSQCGRALSLLRLRLHAGTRYQGCRLPVTLCSWPVRSA